MSMSSGGSQGKSSPKTVKIALQSPQKKPKSPSPPRVKDPFNEPLSKLKKTFPETPNIYSHIQANHDQKILSHELQKQKIKALNEE